MLFWAIIAFVSFYSLFIYLMWNEPPGGYNQTQSLSWTEKRLKIAYDANGRFYDRKILREDAMEVEQMARERKISLEDSVRKFVIGYPL